MKSFSFPRRPLFFRLSGLIPEFSQLSLWVNSGKFSWMTPGPVGFFLCVPTWGHRAVLSNGKWMSWTGCMDSPRRESQNWKLTSCDSCTRIQGEKFCRNSQDLGWGSSTTTKEGSGQPTEQNIQALIGSRNSRDKSWPGTGEGTWNLSLGPRTLLRLKAEFRSCRIGDIIGWSLCWLHRLRALREVNYVHLHPGLVEKNHGR